MRKLSRGRPGSSARRGAARVRRPGESISGGDGSQPFQRAGSIGAAHRNRGDGWNGTSPPPICIAGRKGTQLHQGRPAARRRPVGGSDQIARLEGELGFALFERSGRGVQLTDLGRTFIAEADRILAEIQSLTGRVERLKSFRKETVRIGLGSGTASVFVPKLLPGNHPSVSGAPHRYPDRDDEERLR